MKSIQTTTIPVLTLALALAALPVGAQQAASKDAAAGKAAEPVNISNFARAESDFYFGQAVQQNGLGKLGHERTPANIDDQKVIRMNRDTLYSSGVFDLNAGPASITLPDSPDKRFMSMLVINEDQYVVEVAYAGSGSHTYSLDNVGTRYVIVLFRTFVDPQDAKDVKAVHTLQDAIKVQQASTGTFEVPNWDKVTQDKARDALMTLGALGGLAPNRFGAKKDVEPVSFVISAAMGWGGNPKEAAIYLPEFPKQNDGKTVHKLTLKDVPIDGFWSVSTYNAKGFFEKNELNAYSFNNVTSKKNADGSITLQFGACGKATPNCMPVAEGWNYLLRLYRPRKAILDGTWKIPQAQPLR
jgi:hypothetical protein